MKLFITGVGGLIGSAVAELAASRGYTVTGVDADWRGRWFGKDGSVEWRLQELGKLGVRIIRDDFRNCVNSVEGMDATLHCASQPSHDYSRSHVLQDSAINYMGTVQLLESCRTLAPKAAFIFLSTNKVYGDRVNAERFTIEGQRFVYKDKYEHVCDCHGIRESMPIDASLHTPFGVSKASADLMVQEYRRCFGLNTVTLRCGCLTGKSGSPVELQGFLGYLVRCAVQGKPYTIYGHDGYQVRDNLDSQDLAEAILLCAADPTRGNGVYNMGGGPENSVSVNEVIQFLRDEMNLSFEVKHGPARLGDHRWWVSDYQKFANDYGWKPKKGVWEVIREMASCELRRREPEKGDATLPSRSLQTAGIQ